MAAAMPGIVVEDRGPVFVRFIDGDDDRASVVARADDLEVQIDAGLVERKVADYIEEQQRR